MNALIVSSKTAGDLLFADRGEEILNDPWDQPAETKGPFLLLMGTDWYGHNCSDL